MLSLFLALQIKRIGNDLSLASLAPLCRFYVCPFHCEAITVLEFDNVAEQMISLTAIYLLVCLFETMAKAGIFLPNLSELDTFWSMICIM